ncbi:hypothetical protein V6N13_053915 [Hibiscus sabdariffa]
MGNCFATQQVDPHSRSTVKPSSPESTKKLKDSKQNGSPTANKDSAGAETKSKEGEAVAVAVPPSGKIQMTITLKIFTLVELRLPPEISSRLRC